MSHIIRRDETRRTETPAAIMTTFASPSLGSTTELSMWRVEMAAGQRGPLHRFDSEQLWTVLAGELSVTVDGTPDVVHEGDTVVLPAGTERQITAVTATKAVVCGRGDAVAAVPGEDGSRGTPAWIG